MECSNCKTTNGSGNKYCRECGIRLGASISMQDGLLESEAKMQELPLLVKLWPPVKQIFTIIREDFKKRPGIFKKIYNGIPVALIASVPVLTGILGGLVVIIGWQKPVIDDIRWHRRQVLPGDTVELVAMARGAGLTPLEYRWELSSGKYKSLLNAEEQKIRGNSVIEVEVPKSDDFKGPGQVRVALTVWNGYNESKEKTVLIEVVPINSPPILPPIACKCDTRVIRAGERVELSVTLPDKEKNPVELSWECMCPIGEIHYIDERRTRVFFEVPGNVRPFPRQFEAEIKVKASDKKGGISEQKITFTVMGPGSRNTLVARRPASITRHSDTPLALHDIERLYLKDKDQVYIFKARATGEGLTYRWTYRGSEVGRESTLLFDLSDIKTDPGQGNAELTLTIEDAYKAKVIQTIRMPPR